MKSLPKFFPPTSTASASMIDIKKVKLHNDDLLCTYSNKRRRTCRPSQTYFANRRYKVNIAREMDLSDGNFDPVKNSRFKINIPRNCILF